MGNIHLPGLNTSTDQLKERSGIYAVVCKMVNEYFVTDVGESSKLKTRKECYWQKDCLMKNFEGQLTIFVRYTPFLKLQGRILIEQELREIYHPTCGSDKIVWHTWIPFQNLRK